MSVHSSIHWQNLLFINKGGEPGSSKRLRPWFVLLDDNCAVVIQVNFVFESLDGFVQFQFAAHIGIHGRIDKIASYITVVFRLNRRINTRSYRGEHFVVILPTQKGGRAIFSNLCLGFEVGNKITSIGSIGFLEIRALQNASPWQLRRIFQDFCWKQATMCHPTYREKALLPTPSLQMK